MKNILMIATTLTLAVAARGQQQADTVIVSLGKTSQIIFRMDDRSDIEILRAYNFQQLFDDILTRLEEGDTTDASAGNWESNTDDANDESYTETDSWSNSEDDDYDRRDWGHRRSGRIGSTRQSTNLDFGINNYLNASNQLPDASENHSVRPWGSWYVGLTSLQRTRLANKFFLEWGFGVSWYNLKFENNRMSIVETVDGEAIEFVPVTDNPEFDYIKSKLRITHINFSLVPVIDFNDRGSKPRMWNHNSRSFRFGAGVYAGYKIGSKTKMVYEEEDGDKKTQKQRGGYFLNDFRYGVRAQVGFRSTDFFVNYDMNELFKEGRGPALNAVTFGIIF